MSNPDIQFRRKSPVALADCGAALALEQLPDRWTWLILRALLYDVGRFADIHAEIGVPKSVLSGRLAQLIENGLAQKIAYREGTSRTRHAYVLTAKGRALAPVMLALMRWGDTYLNEGDSALDLFDKRSGTPVEVAIVAKGADVPLKWLGFEPAHKKPEAE